MRVDSLTLPTIQTGKNLNTSEPDNQKIVSSSWELPVFSPLSFGAAKAAINSVRFGGNVYADYGVSIPEDVDLKPPAEAQVQRELLLRHYLKGDNDGTLKLELGSASSSYHMRYMPASAMSNTFHYIDRKVDVIIPNWAYPDALKTIMNATGKRYMMPKSYMLLGPIMGEEKPYDRQEQLQRFMTLHMEMQRELETVIMDRVGIDRETLAQDMKSNKAYNPLQALYYGKKGLVDGILMDNNRVITRKELNAFIEEKGLEGESLRRFLGNARNVRIVPTGLLSSKSGFADTVKNANLSSYRSLKKYGTTNNQGKETTNKKVTVHLLSSKEVAENGGYVKADDHITVVKQAPSWAVIQDQPVFSEMEISGVPASANTLMDDNLIFFNDEFTSESARGVTNAVRALDTKLNTQRRPQDHIKLVLNSPGGECSAGRHMQNAILTADHPVTVIVKGIAASMGTSLLSTVSGLRLASPSTRLMIHSAGTSLDSRDPMYIQQEDFAGLEAETKDYFDEVSDASGRSKEDVYAEFASDVWLNPIEALFYGPKGLIDGIIIGPDEVIVREDVEQYLAKKMGGVKKVRQAAEDHLSRRFYEKDFRHEFIVENFYEGDPFLDPMSVILAMKRNKNDYSLDRYSPYKLKKYEVAERIKEQDELQFKRSLKNKSEPSKREVDLYRQIRNHLFSTLIPKVHPTKTRSVHFFNVSVDPSYYDESYGDSGRKRTPRSKHRAVARKTLDNIDKRSPLEALDDAALNNVNQGIIDAMAYECRRLL